MQSSKGHEDDGCFNHTNNWERNYATFQANLKEII